MARRRLIAVVATVLLGGAYWLGLSWAFDKFTPPVPVVQVSGLARLG